MVRRTRLNRVLPEITTRAINHQAYRKHPSVSSINEVSSISSCFPTQISWRRTRSSGSCHLLENTSFCWLSIRDARASPRASRDSIADNTREPSCFVQSSCYTSVIVGLEVETRTPRQQEKKKNNKVIMASLYFSLPPTPTGVTEWYPPSSAKLRMTIDQRSRSQPWATRRHEGLVTTQDACAR